MWKREEAVKPGSGQQDGRNVVNVGKSVVIKGALHGSEDLTIEGQVEGKSKAQVFAKALVVLGAVNDNIAVSEKGDIRDGGAVEGDIVSPRVAIAEGARFCGSVAMPRTSVPRVDPVGASTAERSRGRISRTTAEWFRTTR